MFEWLKSILSWFLSFLVRPEPAQIAVMSDMDFVAVTPDYELNVIFYLADRVVLIREQSELLNRLDESNHGLNCETYVANEAIRKERLDFIQKKLTKNTKDIFWNRRMAGVNNREDYRQAIVKRVGETDAAVDRIYALANLERPR